MVATAAAGFRQPLGTGKSFSFVSSHNMRLPFAFSPDNVSQTAAYLAAQDSFPLYGRPIHEIEREIKNAVCRTFDRIYKGRLIEFGRDISDGILHPAVVWRGVHCTFSTCSNTSFPMFEHDSTLASGSNVGIVDFTLHVTLGDDGISITRKPVIDSHQFHMLLSSVDSASTNQEKGLVLEELMAYLFNSVEGFTVSGRNTTTETEEIDLVIDNLTRESPLEKEGPIVLVECKNWSTRCGKNELVQFLEKIRNRRRRCTIGVFVSWNGFADTFDTELLRTSQSSEHFVVVPLSGDDVVKSNGLGFGDVLLQRWRGAVLK